MKMVRTSLKLHFSQGRKDEREELGRELEPYARFDKDIERFCCRTCGYQAETFRAMKAHVYTEHL